MTESQLNSTHIPKKILYVEDDEKWQTYIGGLLKNLHHVLIPAFSAIEALNFLREQVFDLIIMNLCLKDNRDYEESIYCIILRSILRTVLNF